MLTHKRLSIPSLVVYLFSGALMLSAVGCGDSGSSPECGDGICEEGEDAESCPEDCATTPECGDGICEEGEDAESCPEDCATTPECGNGICEEGEDAESCPDDCREVECGDEICEGDETPYNCPEDCAIAVCGNGVCDGNETPENCPEDCVGENCGNGICENNETPVSCPDDCEETKALDILFVVDNSPSMASKQLLLQESFSLFFNTLDYAVDTYPDIQIGVVTPNLGTGIHTSIRYCEELGGDKGIMGKVASVNLGETCLGPGQRYMVDVEPDACSIERDESGECTSHECTPEHCEAMEEHGQVLALTTDPDGCPRCRNFEGEPEDALSCLVDVGIMGCGFEQQLEAMHLALNTDMTPENAGFLREDGVLVVVMVTDEDDCSASEPDVIFNPDPSQDNIDSSLGFMHSFRCFEFGVTCDVNDRTPGPRNDCEPRDDEDALLHSVDRYVDFLGYLKDPGRIQLLSLTGPVPETIHVDLDQMDRPHLRFSCEEEDTDLGADPAVRIEAVTSAFNSSEKMNDWAFYEVCEDSFLAPFLSLAEEIGVMLGE